MLLYISRDLLPLTCAELVVMLVIGSQEGT